MCRSKFWQTAPVKRLGIAALLIALTGCTSSQPLLSVSIQQSDVKSISVTKSTQFSVARVVVLANGVAEIINALNGKSIIVGRDISSTEDALKDIPIVTSGHQVISEKVIALNPDLVIVDAATGPKAAIDQIKAAGIAVIQTPESWTLADIATKVKAVSAAVGASAQGEALISALEKEIASSTVKGKPKIAFLYLRGTSSIYLIGGPGSGADSLISAIGAVDIGAQKLAHPFNTLTAESLASLNPDLILVMSKGLESVGGVDGLIKLPGVAQSNAGRNQAIIDVDDSLLLSFGPRTPSLVNRLAVAVTQVMK